MKPPRVVERLQGKARSAVELVWLAGVTFREHVREAGGIAREYGQGQLTDIVADHRDQRHMPLSAAQQRMIIEGPPSLRTVIGQRLGAEDEADYRGGVNLERPSRLATFTAGAVHAARRARQIAGEIQFRSPLAVWREVPDAMGLPSWKAYEDNQQQPSGPELPTVPPEG